MLYVVKRDGRRVAFHWDKIINAIKGSAEEIGASLSGDEVDNLVKVILKELDKYEVDVLTVEEIQNVVERVLNCNGYSDIGRAYSTYRLERTKIREIKSDLMKAIEKIGVQTDRDNGATSCC